MLGGEERVYKNIKDLFGLTYNPKYFTYFRTEPNTPLFQKGDFELHNISQDDIHELHFLYIAYGIIIKIPYKRRFEIQDFLNSGDEQDIPKEIKLIK